MDPRAEQKAWLERVLADTGLPPTTLAQRAKLAPTTLTRFLNDPDHATALSARTIAAVESLPGVARFGDAALPMRALYEPEAEAYAAESAHADLAERVKALTRGATNLSVWTLRSRALETVGFVPGDILIVDFNEPPRRGDVVCAQIYDWRRMKAETVFRLFEPPYLVAATSDRALTTPRLIDKEVGIKSPVLLSVRPRVSAA